jgi:tRNA1Val (adenine37-N6)-methyltransferase
MFTFKQFKIEQAHTAMKVCTDSCLFGAIIKADNHKNALDIGTGTGLLALMLAQKNKELKIDAIEIDAQACIDTKRNFENSSFKNQISLFNLPIQDFENVKTKKYDLVISNPPFYENSLLSPSKKKNIAHHTVLLGLEDLVNSILLNLTDTGKAWIILPPISFGKIETLALKNGLFCSEVTDIHHDTEKHCIRKIGLFERIKSEIQTKQRVNIHENKAYSKRFNELLKDYYLIF